VILADGGTPSLRFELQYLLCGAMQASPPAFSFTMSPVIRQGFFMEIIVRIAQWFRFLYVQPSKNVFINNFAFNFSVNMV
jgi:hypothetical protein